MCQIWINLYILNTFIVQNRNKFSIVQPFLEERSLSDEEDDDHDDDQQAGPDNHPGDGPLNIDIEQIIPIVDSILEQDDKNKDGYLNYAEFMSRQKQHMRS